MPSLLNYNKPRKTFSLCLFCFGFITFSQTSTAGMMGSNVSAQDYLNILKKGQFTLQLGAYARNESSEQFIYMDGVIGDRFTVLASNPHNGLVGVGYFVDGGEYGPFAMSYGVNWFYLPKTRTAGIVLQENEFANLSYAYNVTQYPLYAIAKAIVNTAFPNKKLTLNAGIGPNFMNTRGFKQRSIPTEGNFLSLPNQIFSGKTSTVFSATAGAGIQVAEFFGKAPLACGYQFFYLGQGQFNVLNNQVQNTLKTGQLYANAVMCSIVV